jgi:hypothetical protein
MDNYWKIILNISWKIFDGIFIKLLDIIIYIWYNMYIDKK